MAQDDGKYSVIAQDYWGSYGFEAEVWRVQARDMSHEHAQALVRGLEADNARAAAYVGAGRCAVP